MMCEGSAVKKCCEGGGVKQGRKRPQIRRKKVKRVRERESQRKRELEKERIRD